MANPKVKDGHIRIANDLWLAWMKTGSLKERVFKAIVWECWGFYDTREAKLPVPITRGRIAELTDIADKSIITRRINELVQENRIEKHSGSSLETCSYWPNQDYESWVITEDNGVKSVTRVKSVTSDQKAPVPRVKTVTVPSDQTVTPKADTPYYSTNMMQKEQPEGSASSSSSSTHSDIREIFKKVLAQRNQKLNEFTIAILEYALADYGEEVIRKVLKIALGSTPDKISGNISAFIEKVAPGVKAEMEKQAAEPQKPLVVLDEEGTDIEGFNRLVEAGRRQAERDRLYAEERKKHPLPRIDVMALFAEKQRESAEQKKQAELKEAVS
jgi:hypothetical protein